MALQEELRHRVEPAPHGRCGWLGERTTNQTWRPGADNVLIWKGNQVGLILRTPKGKKSL